MLIPTARAEIKAALQAAPHGERGGAAKQLAAHYGVSTATIYRIAKLDGAKRPRQKANPEYREWTRLAVALAHRGLAEDPLTLDLAIRDGIESRILPPEAADMPLSSAYRIVRELGLKRTRKRTHRMHADWPMQAVQIDWSSSKYLLADRPDGDGDWILKLHRRPTPASGYKNRPLREHRMRLGVYSAWDMNSGYTVARYAVERGESAHGALEFICWALGREKDERLVMHGVPDDLWSDLGPLVRSDSARDLLGRLGIALITGAPYNKSRMGGVERSHRTRWDRFERSLFSRDGDTIRLSELNTRLIEFTVEENAKRPSRTPVAGRPASRAAAWVALTNARPANHPLRRLPDNPLKTLTQEGRRKIDANGILRWDGVEYECPWHDRWVVARRAPDDPGDLVIEDEQTGERRTARRYEPRPYGEIRTAPATALDKLLAESPAAGASADIYAPAKESMASNVRPMPARSAPAAALENPLAGGDACRDIKEAMNFFISIYPYRLSPAIYPQVVAAIKADGLSRQAITQLAQEMSALAQRRRGEQNP